MRLMPLPACVGLIGLSVALAIGGIAITDASKDTTSVLWARLCTLSNDGASVLIAECEGYKHRITKQSEETTAAIGAKSIRVECRAYRARGIGGAILLECT